MRAQSSCCTKRVIRPWRRTAAPIAWGSASLTCVTLAWWLACFWPGPSSVCIPCAHRIHRPQPPMYTTVHSPRCHKHCTVLLVARWNVTLVAYTCCLWARQPNSSTKYLLGELNWICCCRRVCWLDMIVGREVHVNAQGYSPDIVHSTIRCSNEQARRSVRIKSAHKSSPHSPPAVVGFMVIYGALRRLRL